MASEDKRSRSVEGGYGDPTVPIDVTPAPRQDEAVGAAGSGPDATMPLLDVIDGDALADMQAYSSLQDKRRREKRKKIIVGVVVGVLVLAAIGVGATMLLQNAASEAGIEGEVQTTFVDKGRFSDSVSASGKLKPVASVSATPEVEGLVGEVHVSEGDAVAPGQVLYTIVNDELDKAVAQAQQGINEANNGITQAQIALDDAYRAKNSGLAAASSVGGGDAGETAPVFDVGQADSAIRQAQLSLDGAYLAFNNAQAAYDDAVARAAKRTVASPIAGSVIAMNVEPGKSLSSANAAGTPPVQIADLSQMTVSVEVNEIDILKIAADMQATLTFSAIPDLSLPGKVSRIATANTGSGDMGMGGMGAVTYTVDILIEAPDPRLKPGMTAKATIETKVIEDTLMVPVSAVTSLSATEGFVLLAPANEDEQPREVEVEILGTDGLVMAVEGSLSAGDEILMTGGDMMGAGMAAGSSADMAMSGAVMVG